MYTTINFKTKKALKEAVAEGKDITIFQPGPFGGNEPPKEPSASKDLTTQSLTAGMLQPPSKTAK